jgi:thymidylate kinase
MLIVLEGISGAGKSTQLRALSRRLRGVALAGTVGEFSRGPIGRGARYGYRGRRERFVRLHGDERFADQTYLLLLADAVAKAEEIAELRQASAKPVLADRLFDSWLCYTLAAGDRRGLADKQVRELHRSCTKEHVPGDAVTVFLELSPEAAFERLKTRDGFSAGEAEKQRLEKVARHFGEIYARRPVRRVDASLGKSSVTAAILRATGLASWRTTSPNIQQGSQPGGLPLIW